MAKKPAYVGGKGSARRYTNPDTGESISRRQYDKLNRLRGLSYEKLAKLNRQATGGERRKVRQGSRMVTIGPQSAATARARAYAEEHGLTVREAQRDPAFQALQRDLGRKIYKDTPKDLADEIVARKQAAALELYGSKVARQRYESLFRYHPAAVVVAGPNG